MKLAKRNPKYLLDSLIITRRDRRRLGIHGSRLRCEPGLEFRSFLRDERDDVVPVERVRCAERETLFACWVGVGGGQGEDVEAGRVTDVDVADGGSVPDVGV
jgi:hypothetical protein